MRRILQKPTAQPPPGAAGFSILKRLWHRFRDDFLVSEKKALQRPSNMPTEHPRQTSLPAASFRPKPLSWGLQQHGLVTFGSPKVALPGQSLCIEENPRSRRMASLQHVYAQEW